MSVKDSMYCGCGGEELMQAFKGGTGHDAGLLLVNAVERGKMDVNEKIVAADTRLPNELR